MLTEAEKRRRIDALDDECIYRYAYMPFVLAAGVWDYADTVINIAIQLKIGETKRLSRAVRELRRSYEARRGKYATADGMRREMENFIVLEGICSKSINFLSRRIREAAQKKYPDLCAEHLLLVVATYECHYLTKVLFKYAKEQSDKVCRLCGFEGLESLLPSELSALSSIILEFAGDKRVNVAGSGLYMRNIMSKLNTIGFQDERQEIVS